MALVFKLIRVGYREAAKKNGIAISVNKPVFLNMQKRQQLLFWVFICPLRIIFVPPCMVFFGGILGEGLLRYDSKKQANKKLTWTHIYF